MMIHAYDEMYLNGAQRILGDAFDFAVNTVGMDIETFSGLFIVSGLAAQMEMGNPKYVAGCTGCELVRDIMYRVGLSDPDVADVMYMDKSPEYWTGWATAFYQWYRGMKYTDIFQAVPVGDILDMYPVYHEMDIMQFADTMDELVQNSKTVTRLRYYRDRIHMSQSELAQASGVSQRMIQLYEQRQRDINKAQIASLVNLSKVLLCNAEDLLES